MLTVIDPCLTAVVYGSAPADASFSVYDDAILTYSPFTNFYYSSSIGATACGELEYTVSEAPAGVSSLTTFTLITPGDGF